MTTPLPPFWPHCGQGATRADRVGCRGIHVPGHTACLAHLTDADRTAYLTGLTPGADIDHRGTPFTQPLLETFLNALTDPSTGKPRIGSAWFDGAQFVGHARFRGTQFADTAEFREAQFAGPADFRETQFASSACFEGTWFADTAEFREAQFAGPAEFGWTQFASLARFREARFSGSAEFVDAHFDYIADFEIAQFSRTAQFDGARFADSAYFNWAQFSGPARFREAQIAGHARFREAQFTGVSVLGPLVCAEEVVLSGAVFALPVTVEITAQRMVCQRTRWESTATLRVRYAAVDLGHAVLTAPAAVIFHPTPFTHDGSAVSESLLGGPSIPDRVSIVSVQGVDAAHLVLTGTDLTDCLFSGAFHLDQIRLEGRITFADAPTGWHHRGIRPVRWTRRRVLAEEHHWRAQTAGQPVPPAGAAPDPRLWRPGPHHTDPARTPDPEDVATLYRQLRKAFEDGKNEPGAADFYYGECEMRRHDTTGTTTGERRLLWGYWLLSGYGLRASRAFTWLLAAMTLTVLLLMGVGLPTHDPDPTTAGTLNGSRISLNTSTPDPALHGGWSKRMTWARAEKATRVAINSVVFRSSGQNLTTVGAYIEMTSRLLEPTLLALGVLAIRGRIKR
ncbi:pentapeptide repeat-containing protein [Streptomyces sp. NPDC050287]|uniref:pentapeptide repeat-containing protein n=1 Tax=Streptomyces sp. NPDC050287 TaxID=3365608 RepID=UPI00378FB20B